MTLPRRAHVPCLLAALMLTACTTPAVRSPDAGTPSPVSPTPSPAPSAVSTEPPAHGVQAAEAAGPSPGNGLAIYEDFRTGLAEPQCGNSQARWRKHFAHAPQRLGDPGTDTLLLFAHVVESLRAAGLPTEFALIPFVESGYAPGARSKAGPAGLWQFIAVTARGHGLRVEPGYDGRLSPAESTRAAVSYLKSLDDTFDGNWRLVAMAYNAGEYRVLQALRRSGGNISSATPESIKGLSPVTYAYVEKLHALACLLEESGERTQWRAGLDQPVPRLRAVPLENAKSLDAWTAKNDQDAKVLRRFNPALAGHWPSRGVPLALVPTGVQGDMSVAAATSARSGTDEADATAGSATHTVRKGDSAWSIARHYGVTTRRLLELNDLKANSVLRPGMVLRLQ
ncbi:lytic transglycosylase domain-containing protein [Pseudoxanthomonas daejeonensis]|uniref:Lytic transglycosylase n=1 Tax=Pseudoxanthomonas daejeonensis TaxID=266062 RepID=A0ABQ6Z3B1_9GAMM|nr:lytic transglycosylase domain-containing protein [Pseudoxanthomonas daejeonensis]KAF1691936.1 lytic transglycosylase [Pseudoxanthomonas daejeonensis]